MNLPRFLRPDAAHRTSNGRGGTLAGAVRALAIGAAVMLISGCATAPDAGAPAESTKYTLENTDKLTWLDSNDSKYVTCTGLQEHALADGRMEVVANLKNRENRRVNVQASCVFKDEQDLPTGAETPWQTVSIAENATQAVRFVAPAAAAKKYTIRLRQSR